jgi:hypothetical protein
MIPLLEKNRQNPHATLITHYNHVLGHTCGRDDGEGDLDWNAPAMQQLMNIMPPPKPPATKGTDCCSYFQYYGEFIKILQGREACTSYKDAIDRLVY